MRDVTRELLDMGCYEVSLGDTTGTGNPMSVSEMLNVTLAANPVEKLAGHVFDPPLRVTLPNYSFCVSSTILSAWELRIPWPHSAGIRTLDSSIGGLGGCLYSPGAIGNVATEDILYASQDSPYSVPGDLEALVDVGFWISEKLGRANSSRVGKAIRVRCGRVCQTQPEVKP